MQDQLDPNAKLVAHAIALTENGGKIDYNSTGQSQEKGAFQFTPGTWKKYAGDVLGDANSPMTPENQNRVAYTKIKGWLDEGKTPAQVASMWNAGPGEPNAWTGKFGSTTPTHKAGDPSVGVNSFGAKYDVPGYVKTVQKYGQQLVSGQKFQQSDLGVQGGPSGAVLNTVTPQVPDQGLGGKLQGELAQATGLTPDSSGKEHPNLGLSAMYNGAVQTVMGKAPDANPNNSAILGLNNATGGRLEGLANIGAGLSDVAGAAGGAIGDVVGAGLSAITPQWVKDAGSAALHSIFSIPVVQQAAQKVSDLAQQNPELARGAGNAFNIYTSLIPAVKTFQAAKALIFGGISDEVAKTEGGSAIMEQAKAKGVDPLAGVKDMADKTPKTFWNKIMSAGGASPEVASSQLKATGNKLVGQYTNEIGNTLEKSGAQVATDQLEQQAIALAQQANPVNLSRIQRSIKSFLLGLTDTAPTVTASGVPTMGAAMTPKVLLSDLFDSLQSPAFKANNPYLAQAMEDAISTAVKEQGLSSVAAAQLRLGNLTSGLQWLDEFMKIAPKQTARNVVREAVQKGSALAGYAVGNTVAPGAGGALGGLTGYAGGSVAKTLIPNKAPGMLSQALLEQATKSAAGKSLLINAAKTGAAGAVSNVRR